MNINNSQDVTIDGNLFLNPKGTMVAPATGQMNASWYVGNNTWNPNQFLNTTNVTNNPQNGLGIPFVNTTDDFPTTIQTDIVRKVFNLENIGTYWVDLGGPAPNYIGRPKSITARKTSLGWIGKQAIWINGSEYDVGTSSTDLIYWPVPFLEYWYDTANVTVYTKNNDSSTITLSVIGAIPTPTSTGGNVYLSNEGLSLSWYQTNLPSGVIVAYSYLIAIKVELEGLVDVQKVINLTSVNQYVPSSTTSSNNEGG